MGRFLLLALLLAGCAPTTVDLVVDLRTDFVPRVEWTNARVVFDGTDAGAHDAVEADYVRGQRLAEILGVEAGRHELGVTLFDAAGAVLIEQRLVVTLGDDTALTVVLGRECADVVCGENERCLRADCVPAECSELRPDLCGESECALDTECTGPVSCAAGTCAAGECLFTPDDAMCAMDERCELGGGCVPTMPGPTRWITVGAMDSTTVGSGHEVRVTLTAEPAAEWPEDTPVTIDLDMGLLRDGFMAPLVAEVATRISPGGALPVLWVHAPVDLAVGSEMTVTARGEDTRGERVYTVTDAGFSIKDIDGENYRVADGYHLEAPYPISASAQTRMSNRVRTLAFPPSASVWPAQLFVGLDGEVGTATPPSIVRVEGDGAIAPWAESDGVTGPDEAFRQMQFTTSAHPFRVQLFVASASAGFGDGVFYVDDSRAWFEHRSANDVHGMVFDPGHTLGDPGFPEPLYTNVESSVLIRGDDTMDVTLFDMLPANDTGHRLYLASSGPFAGALFLLSAGMDASADDGYIGRVNSVDPFGTLDMFATGLGAPTSAAFTIGGLGERLYVTMEDLGEVWSFRPDGTHQVIVRDLDAPTGMFLHEDGRLFFAEHGRGQILTLEHD